MTDSPAQDSPNAGRRADVVSPPRSAELRRIVRFIAVGVLNTAFGYGVFVTVLFVSHSHTIAVIVANILGVIFNYFTVGQLVFANAGSRRIGLFVLGYVINLALNLALVEIFTRAGIGALVAQAISMPILVLTSYVWNALVVFRKRPEGSPTR